MKNVTVDGGGKPGQGMMIDVAQGHLTLNDVTLQRCDAHLKRQLFRFLTLFMGMTDTGRCLVILLFKCTVKMLLVCKSIVLHDF